MKCIDEVKMVRKERLDNLVRQAMIRKALMQGVTYGILAEKGCKISGRPLSQKKKADQLLHDHRVHEEELENRLDLYWWVAGEIDQFERELSKAQ